MARYSRFRHVQAPVGTLYFDGIRVVCKECPPTEFGLDGAPPPPRHLLTREQRTRLRRPGLNGRPPIYSCRCGRVSL